eukprot:9338023-Lingulodinium_polyedra.AAC.1
MGPSQSASQHTRYRAPPAQPGPADPRGRASVATRNARTALLRTAHLCPAKCQGLGPAGHWSEPFPGR